MKINQLYIGVSCNGLNGLLYLSMPVALTGLKTRMTIGNRSHPCHQNPYIRVYYTKRVDQCQIIPDKKIPIVGPVSRIRIINTQMNDNDVSGKSQRLLKLFLLHIRTVTFIQQSRSGFPEISNDIPLTQHAL